MQRIEQLRTVPDDDLLHRLSALVDGSRRTEADLVAHIGEVDARRLYAREATPSMFAYCLERLHLSEHEAYLRIAAGRACREHPVILDMLADGRLHLTGVALLAPHLTPENREALLQGATHRTKRQIEELLAEFAPRPEVRPTIRRLPAGRLVVSSRPPDRIHGADDRAESHPPVPRSPLGGDDPGRRLGPEQVDSSALTAMGGRPSSGVSKPCEADGESAPAGTRGIALDLRWAPRQEPRASVIEPLSPCRYRVQFTASTELRDKLERLKALMRSSVPSGDLAAIIDAAVTEKIGRLEARRFGRTRSPRKPSRASSAADSGVKRSPATSAVDSGEQPAPARMVARPSSRHVPAEVRRSVYERDQGRCRFVDGQGRRCTARVDLELHHRFPWAMGGGHAPSEMSLLCKAHNRLMAEVDFGERVVGRQPT